MQIEFQHPAFIEQRLVIEPAQWFSMPKLLLNGAPLQKSKGQYSVLSDDGTAKNIQLKFNFIDPIPKVKIDNEVIDVAPPLSWYEYVWIGLPIVLMFIGGALGGMVGGLFTNANGRVFRSERSNISKYGISAAFTISAFISFIILAALFQVAVSAFAK